MALRVGEPAPEFILPDERGELHSLSGYRGRWLVLYFYPRDNTPRCTRQACRFRDGLARFEQLGAGVVGVSLDAARRHRAFRDRHRLNFPLLTDRHGAVARAFGAMFQLGPLRFARRHTFLIDPTGRVARIYRHVVPEQHCADLIADLEMLAVDADGRERPGR
jgi:peroxiredoxin Q/BCP